MLDTVSIFHGFLSAPAILTHFRSRHVRLFHWHLRGQQHRSRLGVKHMLPDEGEESLLPSHRQLHRCLIVYLDPLYVAVIRCPTVHHGHVVECGPESDHCGGSVGDEILAKEGERENSPDRVRGDTVLCVLKTEIATW